MFGRSCIKHLSWVFFLCLFQSATAIEWQQVTQQIETLDIIELPVIEGEYLTFHQTGKRQSQDKTTYFGYLSSAEEVESNQSIIFVDKDKRVSALLKWQDAEYNVISGLAGVKIYKSPELVANFEGDAESEVNNLAVPFVASVASNNLAHEHRHNGQYSLAQSDETYKNEYLDVANDDERFWSKKDIDVAVVYDVSAIEEFALYHAHLTGDDVSFQFKRYEFEQVLQNSLEGVKAIFALANISRELNFKLHFLDLSFPESAVEEDETDIIYDLGIWQSTRYYNRYEIFIVINGNGKILDERRALGTATYALHYKDAEQQQLASGDNIGYVRLQPSVVSSPYIPTHELGHVFGGRHDRYTQAFELHNPPIPKHGNYGYVSAEDQIRSIMSYGGACTNGCYRIDRFSSTHYQHDGKDFGIAIGQDDAADMETYLKQASLDMNIKRTALQDLSFSYTEDTMTISWPDIGNRYFVGLPGTCVRGANGVPSAFGDIADIDVPNRVITQEPTVTIKRSDYANDTRRCGTIMAEMIVDGQKKYQGIGAYRMIPRFLASYGSEPGTEIYMDAGMNVSKQQFVVGEDEISFTLTLQDPSVSNNALKAISYDGDCAGNWSAYPNGNHVCQGTWVDGQYLYYDIEYINKWWDINITGEGAERLVSFNPKYSFNEIWDGMRQDYLNKPQGGDGNNEKVMMTHVLPVRITNSASRPESLVINLDFSKVTANKPDVSVVSHQISVGEPLELTIEHLEPSKLEVTLDGENASLLPLSDNLYQVTNARLNTGGFHELVIKSENGLITQSELIVEMAEPSVHLECYAASPIANLDCGVIFTGNPILDSFAITNMGDFPNISANVLTQNSSYYLHLTTNEPIALGNYEFEYELNYGSEVISGSFVIEIADSDGDGMSDFWERQLGFNPNDPSDAATDFDQDGLTNLEEYLAGINPKNNDTDGDGVLDGEELSLGSDPIDPSSKPAGSFLAQSKVFQLGDINADGISDIGIYGILADDSTPILYRYDGKIGGELIDTVKWSSIYRSPQLSFVDDKTGDGVPEAALFGQRIDGVNAGKWQASVKNGLTGKPIATYNWIANWTQAKLKELNDLTGDGVKEIALEGNFERAKRQQLFVRDGAEPSSKIAIYSFPDLWDKPQYIQLADHNKDGVDDIGFFGLSKKTGKAQIRIKSGVNEKQNIPAYNFPAKWDEPELKLLGDKNGDGLNDLGIFGQSNVDGRWQLFVKKGGTNKGGLGIFSWPDDLTQVQFKEVPDMNDDGVSEYAVFAKRGNKYQLRIKSGNDRAITHGVYNFVTKIETPEFVVLPDSTGDNLAEYGAFGVNTQNGQHELFAMSGDSSNKNVLRTYRFGENWINAKVKVIPDTNGDGIDDIAFYGINSMTFETVLSVYSGKETSLLGEISL